MGGENENWPLNWERQKTKSQLQGPKNSRQIWDRNILYDDIIPICAHPELNTIEIVLERVKRSVAQRNLTLG